MNCENCKKDGCITLQIDIPEDSKTEKCCLCSYDNPLVYCQFCRSMM